MKNEAHVEHLSDEPSVVSDERERMRRSILELVPHIARGSRRRLIQEGYTEAAADEIVINLIRQLLGEKDRDMIKKLLL